MNQTLGSLIASHCGFKILDSDSDYKPNQVEPLADLLPIELMNNAYELTDTATLRKRKLTLESMAWLLVDMSIYNDKSMADIVNRTGQPFVLPSALTQRRKNLWSRPKALANMGHIGVYR
ncbi:Transposase IS4 N-terminal domain-containing protein [Vibrio aquimaris]|uniref:Transposase IS4 N-terminal domain-containing protein n=1 Tax=Vibrio aquimaris TaxID=2587862 RepID=A0A5P9CP39_9VIBR|nr:hypothetical protein FIV01_15250 [Vibrio aquimaris]